MAKPPSPAKQAVDPNTPESRLRELYLDESLHPKLATNPALPSELLRQLGSSPEANIRKKVAANPNTPSELLLQLATQFPEQLLENPIFPLLLLENPLLLSDMPVSTLKSLLKREQVPVEFLAWASDHQDATVIEALLVNPGVTRAMLERALAKHPELAEEITNHASWEGGEVDLEAVEREVRASAVLGLPPAIREGIAKNPETSVDVLEQLATDEKYVRKAVVSNPNTPVDLRNQILEQLATDSNWEVRGAVASNPNTPVSLLEQLASDKDWRIRQAVAYNPNIPVDVLEKLATDSDWAVRRDVARHHNTPVSLLEQLATDGEEYVLEAVAENPNTPADLRNQILEKLATDSNRVFAGQ